MRALTAMAAISLAMVLAAPASAFEGGGRSPSAAPQITIGQHYTGELNNRESDANYHRESVFREVALWRLPALTTHDVLAVDWHSVPFASSPGSFPVCMVFAQGIDDFNWGDVFNQALDNYDCYELSGSGAARTEIVVPATDTSSFLEFVARADETESSRYATYPYDFAVEPILHYLALAITPTKEVNANGILSATAALSNGLPVPDGVNFVLSVSWHGGIASYTGVSGGGVVNFQLALPETAWGKNVRFIATHPADGTYQAVNSTRQTIKVTKPAPTPPSPCVLAKRRAHSLARQLKRLRRHARHAHGRTRRRLNHRAHRTRRKLRRTRHRAAALCV